MPIPPHKLQALMSPVPHGRMPPPGGTPEAWGVLYASPNPDGTRKACANCFMWVSDGSCMIHEPTLAVTDDAVCGYHVFGQPHEPGENGDHEHSIKPVTPGTSGLIRVPGGVSCDICQFYDPVDLEMGLCSAVNSPDGGRARVQARGCCARWTSGVAPPRDVSYASPPMPGPPGDTKMPSGPGTMFR